MGHTLKFRFIGRPPSQNKRINKNRDMGVVYPEAEYAAWKKQAAAELLTQQRGRLPEFCYWRVDILYPANPDGSRPGTRPDLNNMDKALIDLLVAQKRVPDDRYLVDHRQRWCAGNYTIIAIREESLTLWESIMKPGKSLLKKLERCLNFGQKNL